MIFNRDGEGNVGMSEDNTCPGCGEVHEGEGVRPVRERRPCPVCLVMPDLEQPLGEQREGATELALCFCCGTASIVEADGTYRPLTEEEAMRAFHDPGVVSVVMTMAMQRSMDPFIAARAREHQEFQQ